MGRRRDGRRRQAALGEALGKRALVVVGSVLATGLLLALALSLGSWGFTQRRLSLHAGRLQRLLELHPAADRVQAGLETERIRLVGRATALPELRSLATRWAPAQATVVLEKGTRFAETRFFLAGEILYVIFFDEAGTMRDFVCLDTSL